MKSPFTGGEAVLVTETRKAVFRKEEYEYTHLCYQCVDTQETFTTTQVDTFKNDNSVSISNKSHEEPAWIDNQGTHSFIDFKYAFLLKAI